MKLALLLLAIALLSYGVFATYRLGVQQGRDEGAGIALAVAAGARYEVASEIGTTVGHPSTWDGLSREQFQDLMARRSEAHFADLQTALRPLPKEQREVVISVLWDSLSEEEERRLRQIPLP